MRPKSFYDWVALLGFLGWLYIFASLGLNYVREWVVWRGEVTRAVNEIIQRPQVPVAEVPTAIPQFTPERSK